MKKMAENLDCGITVAMKIFGGKWKPCIIDAIAHGHSRPSEMARYISEAPQRVIEMQLKELEMHGMVEKLIFGGFPLRTEYALTEAGRSALPIIDQLNNWGMINKELVAASSPSAVSETAASYNCFAANHSAPSHP